VTEKLTKFNYLLWHAQIISAIRAAQFEGFLHGSEKEPPKIIFKTVTNTIVNEANPASMRCGSLEINLFWATS
jgi:hypothetical protein